VGYFRHLRFRLWFSELDHCMWMTITSTKSVQCFFVVLSSASIACFTWQRTGDWEHCTFQGISGNAKNQTFVYTKCSAKSCRIHVDMYVYVCISLNDFHHTFKAHYTKLPVIVYVLFIVINLVHVSAQGLGSCRTVSASAVCFTLGCPFRNVCRKYTIYPRYLIIIS